MSQNNQNETSLEKETRKTFAADTFSQETIGAKIESMRPGYCLASMQADEHHLNACGVLHGGALFTLADFASAVVANMDGQTALSVKVNVEYIKAGNKGLLTAESHETARKGRLILVDTAIRDSNGTLLASVKSTFCILKSDNPISAH